jgi:hypothetical protein
MNRLLLKLAITAAAGCLLSSNPMVAQLSPTTPKAARFLYNFPRAHPRA